MCPHFFPTHRFRLNSVFDSFLYTANFIIPTSRGPNLTLISAINGEKVLLSIVLRGSVKAAEFKSFLVQLLPVLENEGIRNECILIYDNAVIHHASVVEDYIDEQGIDYKYLSPYSYMLNPIEFCFGKIKTHIRNNTSNNPNLSLLDAVFQGIESITEEDLCGYFRHIENNCVLALQNEDF